MAKQSEQTKIGLIEWDFDDGKFDIWCDGILIVDDGKTVADTKISILEPRSNSMALHRKINNYYQRHEIACPSLFARYISVEKLGPNVAQIPHFASYLKPDKDAVKFREARIKHFFKKYPEYQTWLVYLTNTQPAGWHDFVKKYGFVETKKFFNPNSDNTIKEYTYAC